MRDVIFHFNKGSIQDPDIPMWVIKARGETHYVHHVTSHVGWCTRETPESSTRGSLKFKQVRLVIYDDNTAVIFPQENEHAIDQRGCDQDSSSGTS